MLYHPFFVTPAIFKPGSMVLKPLDSRLNFGMTEKKVVTPECFYQGSTALKTKEEAKTWMPDKDFRNDRWCGCLAKFQV